MTVYIHRLETSVPATYYEQEFASELMQKNVSDRAAVKRVIRGVYNNTGIRKRHSVINDFNGSADPALFFDPDGMKVTAPDTHRRNDIYSREARKLFVDLAGKLISRTPDFTREDITHVITVSCTGFFAPGPDYYVVRELGLHGSTQRYHIGFMGCYAAFQGLKMADSFCRSDPEAVVLVLCVELCTLNLQFSDDTDSIISASVFGDGGAGALVSARKPAAVADQNGSGTQKPFQIRSFHSDLTSEGESDMAWTIGNEGFRMRLSTYVPEIIRKNIKPSLDNILSQAGVEQKDITRWAVHPGGRAILDKVQQALGISDEAMAASRHVLSEYGNMSSATVLFVLKRLAEEPGDGRSHTIFSMAFGPGLTLETGLFQTAGNE